MLRNHLAPAHPCPQNRMAGHQLNDGTRLGRPQATRTTIRRQDLLFHLRLPRTQALPAITPRVYLVEAYLILMDHQGTVATLGRDALVVLIVTTMCPVKTHRVLTRSQREIMIPTQDVHLQMDGRVKDH